MILANFIIEMINLIILALGTVLSWILGILPDSPFQQIDNSGVSEYMGAINWIIPIGPMLSILQAWLIAIIGYYIVMLIMRWIRAIE